MLTVTFALWFNPHERRNAQYVYDQSHVNHAKRQVAARLSVPHEFVVIADRADGFDPDIRVVPFCLSQFPPRGRYPKLMIFRPDAGALIGSRILLLDLDMAAIGPLDPLVDRTEDVVLWPADPRFFKKGAPRYNTSIVLLRAGSRPQVWELFDKERTPAIVKAEHRDGSDQVWVSKLLPDEATWGRGSGIYQAKEIEGGEPPGDARLVFFPGKDNPMLKATRRKHTWLKTRTA